MIQVREVRKAFGKMIALDSVSFCVPNGQITAFLGPNGAGKSTLMKIAVGLERADAGQVDIDGQQYHRSNAPLALAGSLIDASWMHPRRSARDHLRTLSLTHGIKDDAVDRVLHLSGLSTVATKKVGTFSLGMRQRLGIAAALVASPRNLILDEPANGLDPDGVAWIRRVCRTLADEGCAVLLSSHLLSEISLTADRVVVIAGGVVLADSTMSDLRSSSRVDHIIVDSLDNVTLAHALREAGSTVATKESSELRVHNIDAPGVCAIAAKNDVLLRRLEPVSMSLEDVFLQLTLGRSAHLSETRVPTATAQR